MRFFHLSNDTVQSCLSSASLVSLSCLAELPVFLALARGHVPREWNAFARTEAVLLLLAFVPSFFSLSSTSRIVRGFVPLVVAAALAVFLFHGFAQGRL